jgi:hypothetical protein
MTPEQLQLHDIHLPQPAGWWPPAPGWWILAVITLVFCVWLFRKSYRFWVKKRRQQRLLKAFNKNLSELNKLDDPAFMTEISARLRRLALTLFDDSTVAALSGRQWLQFLDTKGATTAFTQPPANLLVELPYHPGDAPLTAEQRRQVLKLAGQWARHTIRAEAGHAV